MRRTIKLRESELKRMIAESVKRVLNEELSPEEQKRWEKEGAWASYTPTPDEIEQQKQQMWDKFNFKKDSERYGRNAMLKNYLGTPWDDNENLLQKWPDEDYTPKPLKNVAAESVERIIGKTLRNYLR